MFLPLVQLLVLAQTLSSPWRTSEQIVRKLISQYELIYILNGIWIPANVGGNTEPIIVVDESQSFVVAP